MARKSRKLSNIMPITAASQNRSAIYLRLSMENNGQNNTDSIENGNNRRIPTKNHKKQRIVFGAFLRKKRTISTAKTK